MPNWNDEDCLTLQRQAECEVAAFLKAASAVVGLGGCCLSADAWLCTMESLSWPTDNHQKFFRRVSIKAISQIVANSHTKIRNTGRTDGERIQTSPALHSGL